MIWVSKRVILLPICSMRRLAYFYAPQVFKAVWNVHAFNATKQQTPEIANRAHKPNGTGNVVHVVLTHFLFLFQ